MIQGVDDDYAEGLRYCKDLECSGDDDRVSDSDEESANISKIQQPKASISACSIDYYNNEHSRIYEYSESNHYLKTRNSNNFTKIQNVLTYLSNNTQARSEK